MDIGFFETERQSVNYTSQLLKHLLRKRGFNVVSIEKSDVIFVSVCDVMEIPLLKKAFELFGGKKIIVSGGAISFLPVMRFYSDYVVNGEAYEFFDYLRDNGLKNIEDLPYVATRHKPSTARSQVIKWEENPIIQTTKRLYYYYAGKGCRFRCKFCLVSNNNKFQSCPQHLIISALRKIPNGFFLTFITNNFEYNIPQFLYRKIMVRDYTVSGYLKERNKVRGKIRIGIEFCTEKNRKLFGKPITNEEIKEVIVKSKKDNCELMLFFILGVESQEEVESFIDILPVDFSLFPRIILKFTYIDFSYGTPIWECDVREKKRCDMDSIFKKVLFKNKRIRTYGCRDMTLSTWRTLLQRTCNIEEADFIMSLRNVKNNEQLIDIVQSSGYEYLLGSKKLSEVI